MVHLQPQRTLNVSPRVDQSLIAGMYSVGLLITVRTVSHLSLDEIHRMRPHLRVKLKEGPEKPYKLSDSTIMEVAIAECGAM